MTDVEKKRRHVARRVGRDAPEGGQKKAKKPAKKTVRGAAKTASKKGKPTRKAVAQAASKMNRQQKMNARGGIGGPKPSQNEIQARGQSDEKGPRPCRLRRQGKILTDVLVGRERSPSRVHEAAKVKKPAFKDFVL